MVDKLKVFCNHCNTLTNHNVLCEHKIDDVTELEYNGSKETHYLGSYLYQIIQCNGCESISFRSADYHPNFLEVDNNGKSSIITDKLFETFYPERSKDILLEKKIVGLPLLIRIAYRELIDSYNFNQLILCAAGLRAIVEGVCNHFSINGQYLKDRIKDLGENGLISKELSDSLIIHKYLGDFAMHQLSIPEKDELESAIHLIEHALETLFGIPDRHKKLKEKILDRVTKK